MQVGLQSSCTAQAAHYFILSSEAQQPSAEQFVRSTASLFEACGLGTLTPFPASPAACEGAVFVVRSPTIKSDPPLSAKAPQSVPSEQGYSIPGCDLPSSRSAVLLDRSVGSRQQQLDEDDDSTILLRTAAPGAIGKNGSLLGVRARELSDPFLVPHSSGMPLYERSSQHGDPSSHASVVHAPKTAARDVVDARGVGEQALGTGTCWEGRGSGASTLQIGSRCVLSM
jgi:hypothetical protein